MERSRGNRQPLATAQRPSLAENERFIGVNPNTRGLKTQGSEPWELRKGTSCSDEDWRIGSPGLRLGFRRKNLKTKAKANPFAPGNLVDTPQLPSYKPEANTLNFGSRFFNVI